ncbi:MAG: hypothetical protein FD146_2362 [Anaerolineaceae bacterium]|nr:MAG: hypothetical protein FD146_2362 [Anaerolineaceae bacterium]
MISSRCKDNFPPGKDGKPLSEIRLELCEEIERLKVFGKPVFEVWINETTPPQGGTWDSRDTCLRAVENCDILLVLYNGNAGWAKNKGELGICHAEYDRGLSLARDKVRVVDISTKESLAELRQDKNNELFQDYFNLENAFRGGDVTTVEDLKKRVKETLHGALISLAQGGVREAARGKPGIGDALTWSRLDFASRERKMVTLLRNTLVEQSGGQSKKNNVIAPLAGVDILLVPHAIPAAFSIGQAKEMVGQPFLRDHELADTLTDGVNGPVHIIACYKSATESQAIKLLGFPDATVVTTPFGVFVADNVQKVQFAFIANCCDEASIRNGVHNFLKWLARSGEDVYLAARAGARARIVQAIARETPSSPGASR